jgi:hypothetical protein
VFLSKSLVQAYLEGLLASSNEAHRRPRRPQRLCDVWGSWGQREGRWERLGEAGEVKQWNRAFEQFGRELKQMVVAAPDLIQTRPVALCVVQDVAGVLWDEEEAWRWQGEPGEAKHWN